MWAVQHLNVDGLLVGVKAVKTFGFLVSLLQYTRCIYLGEGCLVWPVRGDDGAKLSTVPEKR